jgi:uncharacterized protein HemX
MSHNFNGDAQDGEGGFLIWILLIVLLLGGVGFGGYWVLGQRQQAARQAEMQALEAERNAKEAAEAARKARAP